jgi:hypothetical protein
MLVWNSLYLAAAPTYGTTCGRDRVASCLPMIHEYAPFPYPLMASLCYRQVAAFSFPLAYYPR